MVVAQTPLNVDPETRAILVGPPSVVDTAFPGALDVEALGEALTARFDAILLVQDRIGGVEEFAVGNNLSSIRSIVREASGRRVLALEGDEIVRVFPDGPQSIVTRSQLFGSADVRDLAVVTGGDIFVSDGLSTNLIRIDAANPNPDTNQSSLPGDRPRDAFHSEHELLRRRRALRGAVRRGGAGSRTRRGRARTRRVGRTRLTISLPEGLASQLSAECSTTGRRS